MGTVLGIVDAKF